MKYEFRATLDVAPTMGLDGAVGTVMIVGIHDFTGLPGCVDRDSWTDGWSETEMSAFVTQPWYSFRYLDAKNDSHWGICTVPEWALDELVASAAK